MINLPPVPTPDSVARAATPEAAAAQLSGPAVVCVGTFDGVHRGHQAILARARQVADDLRLPLWAISFHPHPKTIVAPDQAPKLLTEPEERCALLAGLGADGVLLMEFDRALARTSASEFARSVLAGTFQSPHVVVGADFGFGRGREGTASSLADWGRQNGIEVTVVELIHAPSGPGATRISSTNIRNALINNRFNLAVEYLGHPYPVTGAIRPGTQTGAKLGYPTWNLWLSDTKLPPPVGVYAASTARPTPRPAMAYYGSRPTFDEGAYRLEVHLLGGASDDLHPQARETVWLHAFVRPEVRFTGPDELASQLAEDRQVIARALGFNDTENSVSGETTGSEGSNTDSV